MDAPVFCLVVLGLATAMSISLSTTARADAVLGPWKCDRCHEVALEVWFESRHATSFHEMPKLETTQAMLKRLGVRNMTRAGLCVSCHFTVTGTGPSARPVAGVSCESCHGPAERWNKVHAEYSGKTPETETAEERKKRWRDSEAAGMIRPHHTYRVAKNCLECHIVNYEELVDRGGHSDGGDFELMSWATGALWHRVEKGFEPSIEPATQDEKRRLFVIGKAVTLELALRAVATATTKGTYAKAHARRAHAARKAMARIAEVLPLPEINDIVAASKAVKLRLNNEKALL